MNKIETDFDKLKHYEDIETYYPPLDDIKDFLYELFGDRVESQKYIVRANKKIEQLQSNWNSLREWINTRIQANIIRTGMRSEELLIVLDKMNELEGKDKK